jgi:hypothetical protein
MVLKRGVERRGSKILSSSLGPRDSVRDGEFELSEGRFVVFEAHVRTGATVGEEGRRYTVFFRPIVVGEGSVVVAGGVGDVAAFDPCGSACRVFFEVAFEGCRGG